MIVTELLQEFIKSRYIKGCTNRTIEDYEYFEITPDYIRIRKAILDPKDRYRENRN